MLIKVGYDIVNVSEKTLTMVMILRPPGLNELNNF